MKVQNNFLQNEKAININIIWINKFLQYFRLTIWPSTISLILKYRPWLVRGSQPLLNFCGDLLIKCAPWISKFCQPPSPLTAEVPVRLSYPKICNEFSIFMTKVNSRKMYRKINFYKSIFLFSYGGSSYVGVLFGYIIITVKLKRSTTCWWI